MTEIIRDAADLQLQESFTDVMSTDQFVASAERSIGTDGLKWSLRVYAYYNEEDDMGQMRVCLWLSGPTFASGKVSWGMKCEGAKAIKLRKLPAGETTIVKAINTSNLGDEGYVRCDVEFQQDPSDIKLPSRSIDEFLGDATHYEPDAIIVVGNDRLQVHRSILLIISPIFHSYFKHDTRESKTGVIEITDFDYNTIKNVIDYAYGRKIGKRTVSEVVDMLRFADKYDIKTILKLESIFETELSCSTFSTVAQYAWNFERKELQTLCAKFYRKNLQHVTLTPGFVQLTPDIQSAIISAAASQPV